MRSDIIMAEFDESKHPRKKDGKFAPKGKSEQRLKELERKFNDNLPIKPNIKLTKQEWALWYKAISETKALGYWSEKTEDGNAILTIENNGKHKIVITSGTFATPKAKEVYSFSNSDKMNDFIKELKK